MKRCKWVKTNLAMCIRECSECWLEMFYVGFGIEDFDATYECGTMLPDSVVCNPLSPILGAIRGVHVLDERPEFERGPA